MDCRADQPIDHADIIDDEFAPVTMPASSMVCGFRQMFLD